MAKPNIIIEQSPWSNFFAGLPQTAMQFIQAQRDMKYRADERQKDREFQMTSMLLQEKINSKNALRKGLIDLHNQALEDNLSLDVSLNTILKNSPENSTSSSSVLLSDLQNYQQKTLDYYSDQYQELSDQVKLANQGRQVATVVDQDLNSFIDDDELQAYVDKHGEVGSAFIQGMRAELLKPKVRERQDERKKQYNTAQVINSLDQLSINFPGQVNKKHVLAAKNLFNADPNSPKIADQITKAYTESPDSDLVSGDFMKNKDTTIRSSMSSLNEYKKNIDDEFFRGLPLQGGEDFKANFVNDLEYVEAMRSDIETNFAHWFSGKTSEDGYYPVKPAKWIKDKFNFDEAGNKAGWKNISESVGRVMADPRWDKVINTPGGLANAFEWKGKKKGAFKKGKLLHEESANNFVKKTWQIYNDLDEVADKQAFGGTTVDLLKSQGVSKIDPNQTQVDLNNANITPVDQNQQDIPVTEGVDPFTAQMDKIDNTEVLLKDAKIDLGNLNKRMNQMNKSERQGYIVDQDAKVILQENINTKKNEVLNLNKELRLLPSKNEIRTMKQYEDLAKRILIARGLASNENINEYIINNPENWTRALQEAKQSRAVTRDRNIRQSIPTGKGLMD